MNGEVKTVLICDDESKTRKALRALLLARETTRENDPAPMIRVVGEARHGLEAVQMVETLQPEVVIMDASMPGIGGMEASRIIKHKWPQVKVVMLTMYPDARVAALDSGVDIFLVKGCLAEALFDAILG
jgi:DNA-binding NarL/FixJ family response regulator